MTAVAYILRRRKLGRTSTPAIAALSTTGIRSRRDSDRIPEDATLVFRWGCTSNIPVSNVVNTASAIHGVNDKLSFRRTLHDAELCPTTYFTRDQIERTPSSQGILIRPKSHSRGLHMNVVYTLEDFDELIRTAPYLDGWYGSEVIAKVAEYRVFVVQGRAVAVAEKTPDNPEDLAWNVARGGRFDNVSWDAWPLKAVKVSIEAFNLSTLDFGGVDVIVDAEGKCDVIEINSAPSLTSEYRQQCMAKAFDYIVENGKERIPLIEAKGGYRKFIHPAICERAL
jgi:glutathione synthase/RimK-type ligase-like ATP-grasp enzyme